MRLISPLIGKVGGCRVIYADQAQSSLGLRCENVLCAEIWQTLDWRGWQVLSTKNLWWTKVVAIVIWLLAPWEHHKTQKSNFARQIQSEEPGWTGYGGVLCWSRLKCEETGKVLLRVIGVICWPRFTRLTSHQVNTVEAFLPDLSHGKWILTEKWQIQDSWWEGDMTLKVYVKWILLTGPGQFQELILGHMADDKVH